MCLSRYTYNVVNPGLSEEKQGNLLTISWCSCVMGQACNIQLSGFHLLDDQQCGSFKVEGSHTLSRRPT